MHSSTALIILQHLAQQKVLDARGTSFTVAAHPMHSHPDDIREAFIALADVVGGRGALSFGVGSELTVRMPEKIFEKIFKVVFTIPGFTPGMEGWRPENPPPLPILFIGSEKVQIRQIPLVYDPPYPYRFLLELGGMLIIKGGNHHQIVNELKQYLNNHPQYQVMIDAKETPDGGTALFTYWFKELPKLKARHNVNVPDRIKK